MEQRPQLLVYSQEQYEKLKEMYGDEVDVIYVSLSKDNNKQKNNGTD